MFQLLNVWMFKYFNVNVWVFQFLILYIRVFEYMFECLNNEMHIWVFEYVDAWICGCLNIRALESRIGFNH